MPEPLGCVLKGPQVGQGWTFHAARGISMDVIPARAWNPLWTPGTTDILWADFLPTLQMLCDWKFPFKCLRYLGKFPADAAVATEPWQQSFEHLTGHLTELSLDFLTKISLFAAAATALCVYYVLFPPFINISLNEDNPCLYTWL